MLALSAAATSYQQRIAVRALTAPPAAAYRFRTASPLLAESAKDGWEDRRAGREARGEYQTQMSQNDIDEWLSASDVKARGRDAPQMAAPDAEERPMSQADIDEWLGARSGTVDDNVLDAMRNIADAGAMRVPAARAAAVPPAPARSEQDEAGLRWTESSSTSGIEAWGTWSQTERDVTFELYVADETRGKQVSCEVSAGVLDVRVSGEPVFHGELAQQLRPTDLEWVLDTLSDGRKVVCVELPKRGDSSGPLFLSVRMGGEEVAAHGLAVS